MHVANQILHHFAFHFLFFRLLFAGFRLLPALASASALQAALLHWSALWSVSTKMSFSRHQTRVLVVSAISRAHGAFPAGLTFSLDTRVGDALSSESAWCAVRATHTPCPPGVASERYFSTLFANCSTPGFDRNCSAPDNDLHTMSRCSSFTKYTNSEAACVCVGRQLHEDVG